MNPLTIAANMRRAARDRQTVEIGGGLFDPAELTAAAGQLEAFPELLAALKNALNVLAGVASGDLKTVRADSPAITAARQAIAKATGGH